MAAATPRRLLAGRVGRPHGLDGSFHATQPRPALLVLGARVHVGGREAEVVRRAGTDERPVLRLDVASSREELEGIRGADLLVDRAAAPALEDDEFYAEDLEGLAVVDGERPVGRVAALLALPSCEVLQVTRDGDGGELLVPLVSDAVRRVDLEAGRVDVDLAFLDVDPGPDGPGT